MLPINRYWTSPGVSPEPASLLGVDDQFWYRLTVGLHAKQLEELREVPCILLLGEPALGKSTAIRQEIDLLSANSAGSEHCRVQRIDLAESSSDYALDSAFEQDAIRVWQSDDSILHLYLDSYDESLRQYSNLKRRLMRNLRRLRELDRLRLRVAFRIGDFPGQLPEELKALWQEFAPRVPEPVSIFRLEPLTTHDVRAWASAIGVDDVESFLQEVDRRNAGAFARRPITLRALLTEFMDGRFPTDEVGLYKFATQSLCSEENPDRQGELKLSPESMFAIAERIAALMTLGGSDLLWVGLSTKAPNGVMGIEELAGGTEVVSGHLFDVDRIAIKEVIDRCALFDVFDVHLVRWSQQTYREFLAAHYFYRRLRNRAKALQFFEHAGRPGSLKRQVAPQLAESASWLAAMDAKVAALLAERDPAILLRARHFVFPTVRPRLARWLLSEVRQGRTINLDWTADRARESVCHADLQEDLHAILAESGSPVEARTLACWLAGACGLLGLAEVLLAIALDMSESMPVRWAAVLALGEVGTSDAKASLLPLLSSIAGDSSFAHRLRGQVLNALWPDHISTREALDYLLEHQIDPTDEYRDALGRRRLSQSDTTHLVEALQWIASRSDQPDGALRYRIEDILVEAAKRITDVLARVSLASTLVARIESNHVGSPGHDADLVKALRGQPAEARVELVDAVTLEYSLKASVIDGSVYELSEFILGLELPFDEIVARAADADELLEQVWVQVLHSDSRTRRDPQALEALRALIRNNEPCQ